jgi:hypothetical protein
MINENPLYILSRLENLKNHNFCNTYIDFYKLYNIKLFIGYNYNNRKFIYNPWKK